MRGTKILLFLVAGALSLSSYAGVNLKNGNFYISYSDIVGFDLKRTYNSKSTSVGWYGFGWGTVYETKLVPSADGCVVIHEYGAGGKTRFCPKNSVDADAAAKKIVEVMRKKNKLPASSVKPLLKRLKNNAELRHAYAQNFNVKTKIAAGSELYSNQRGIQKVVVQKTGYKRISNDGKEEHFDKAGNLTKVKTKGNYTVELVYNKNKLKSIKDSKGAQVYFDWYSNGKRIKHLWTTGEKKATFKYDGENLVYSKDIQGNEYEYRYDTNHNMVRVVYNPSRKKGEPEDFMKMDYEDKTFFVSEIKDRNGDVTKYKYGSNPKKPNDHYWTEVTKTGFNGKPVTNKYEYEIKTKPDGARYTYRIATKINGIKTETIYSECCGLPLKIARGKHVTNFEYNDDGLLTKKTSTKGDFVQIEYDKKHKKIKKVTNAKGWTKFAYNDQGNLERAVNSAGKAVLLIYNSKEKISKMVDKDKKTKKVRTLSFEYNALDKPEVIKMDKVGQIRVTYDNYGDIKRVESKAGHKMAMQVTQAFQNLLAIVKPAGVNLNM
ncbi:MAG: hypothetical protein CME64_15645 [Halobacteriovoraceae bacterium]|nr:hypothetical protein [Halobacteriovoraceae bacterium]|tara:strand:+ start:179180 stop:180817 length:1638 start_codon:yes stop_codon:yes gene_type:complete